jgi:hypothetical protein
LDIYSSAITIIAMPDKKKIADLHFMDARCKLIDLAAFLDRMDRHPGAEDYRDQALRQCLPILLENRSDRAKAVLDALSDHSTDLLESAPFQGAFGAPQPQKGGMP